MSERVANVRAASTTGPSSDALAVRDTVGCAAIVRMNRENKRNALSGGMLRELTMMVAEAGRDDAVSGIVLTGGRRYFSAGADLAEAVQVKTPADFEPFAAAAADLNRAIEENPKPVIAVIHGPCITGGLEVAMACDERIAAQGSTFAMTSSRIGSVAGFGGTQRLPRLVGLPAAKRMMFSSRIVEADEALDMGLIDVLAPAEDTLQVALSRIEDYSAVGPLSIALTKRAVHFGAELPLAAGLELERALCARAFATEDKEEGMRAFLEKRVAHFHGR
jgi:enoyl-CoA hydratase/carnithine racemase